jgi:hypothetical protein
MMKDFFPPDVSVRLRGDRAVAQTHFGDVRKMLFKAINIGNNPMSLVEHFNDGTTAVVLLAGDQKIITITAPPVEPVEEKREETWPKYTPTPSRRSPMLSGWTRTHTVVSGAAHEYYPSPAMVQAYDFDSTWQDVEQLNTTTYPGDQLQVATYFPSQYSGAMKRVVQALLGLGVITEEGPSFVSQTTYPDPRAIKVLYKPDWIQTHGIYKAGPKNHWLVEISYENGVLAMPLVTLPSTRAASYLSGLEARGDTDTAKVVREFGGIPSGETFPTGNELTTAIAQGKVLRLLTKTDLAPFYKSRVFYAREDGWAFSESGAKAHNTCWLTESETRTNANSGTSSTRLQAYGEHWGIELTLSVHDMEAPYDSPPGPVGTGSATLTRLHRGRISSSGLKSIVANVGGGFRRVSDYISASSLWPSSFSEDNTLVGAIIRVFFDGETMKTVRWVNGKMLRSGSVTKAFEVPLLPYVIGVGPNPTIPPRVTSQLLARSEWSPEGFVGDFDMRTLNYAAQADMQVLLATLNNLVFGPINNSIYYVSNYLMTAPGAPGLYNGEGDVSYAQTYGPGVLQDFQLVIPQYCREGYVIYMNSRYYNLVPTLQSRSYLGVEYQSGEVYLPDLPYNTYNGGRTVGYFAGLGLINFQHQTREAQYAGNETPLPQLRAKVSARQTEYQMDNGVHYQGSSYRPILSNVGAPSMTYDLPEKMNWVGAPD